VTRAELARPSSFARGGWRVWHATPPRTTPLSKASEEVGVHPARLQLACKPPRSLSRSRARPLALLRSLTFSLPLSLGQQLACLPDTIGRGRKRRRQTTFQKSMRVMQKDKRKGSTLKLLL
jgi:hypothetical protein